MLDAAPEIGRLGAPLCPHRYEICRKHENDELEGRYERRLRAQLRGIEDELQDAGKGKLDQSISNAQGDRCKKQDVACAEDGVPQVQLGRTRSVRALSSHGEAFFLVVVSGLFRVLSVEPDVDVVLAVFHID